MIATRPAAPRPLAAAAAPHAPGAGVLLHEEPALQPRAGADGAHPALLARLLRAGGTAQRRQQVRDEVQALGFEWLGCGRVLAVDRRALPLSFCTTYAHSQWAADYFRQRHHEVDPRLQRALQSSLPTVWTLDALAERHATGPEAARLLAFLDGLRGTGARSGVMFALPGERADERHVMSLLSRAPDTAWIDDALLGRVLTLCLCLHELYGRHARAPEPPAPASALSRLQCDILSCVARGMPDKVIAAQLNLTLHNVDYHLRRLRRRFGVRNRVQLTQAIARQPEAACRG